MPAAITLAYQAMGQMSLQAPQARTAPEAPLKTYTGLETWLWMPQGQWAPQRLTVGVPGVAVTVTAEPVRMWWGMGDGGHTTCPGPGRPWVKGMSDDAKTSCSYTYRTISKDEPGGTFDVQSLIVYRVSWTCAGGACTQAGGDFGEIDGPITRSDLRVGERQSVIVNGPSA